MFNQDPRVLAVVSGQRYEPDEEDEVEAPEQLSTIAPIIDVLNE